MVPAIEFVFQVAVNRCDHGDFTGIRRGALLPAGTQCVRQTLALWHLPAIHASLYYTAFEACVHTISVVANGIHSLKRMKGNNETIVRYVVRVVMENVFSLTYSYSICYHKVSAARLHFHSVLGCGNRTGHFHFVLGCGINGLTGKRTMEM